MRGEHSTAAFIAEPQKHQSIKKQKDPGKKTPADLPDVKKIEKQIQTDNQKKPTDNIKRKISETSLLFIAIV